MDALMVSAANDPLVSDTTCLLMENALSTGTLVAGIAW